ncbi:hypothetical protein DITRI_Ditri19aG0124900 [Diplodiscus trichospermus]
MLKNQGYLGLLLNADVGPDTWTWQKVTGQGSIGDFVDMDVTAAGEGVENNEERADKDDEAIYLVNVRYLSNGDGDEELKEAREKFREYKTISKEVKDMRGVDGRDDDDIDPLDDLLNEQAAESVG